MTRVILGLSGGPLHDSTTALYIDDKLACNAVLPTFWSECRGEPIIRDSDDALDMLYGSDLQ